MPIAIDELSGGPLGAMWYAFRRQGLWTPSAAFALTQVVRNGDTSIRVNALPNAAAPGPVTNLFAPVIPGSPTPANPGDPAVGAGKLLRIVTGLAAPQPAEIQIQIRRVQPFEEDGGEVIIYLEKPVEGLIDPPTPAPPEEIAIGAEIAMGHSPVLSVGAYPRRIALYSTIHTVDDRGDARSASPAMNLQTLVSDNQNGPFATIPGPALPGFGAPTPPDTVSLSVVTFELPPVNYLKFIASPGGGDDGATIFSLGVSKSLVTL